MDWQGSIAGAEPAGELLQVVRDRLAGMAQTHHVGVDRSDVLAGSSDLVSALCAAFNCRTLSPLMSRGDVVLSCSYARSGPSQAIEEVCRRLDGPFDPDVSPKVPKVIGAGAPMTRQVYFRSRVEFRVSGTDAVKGCTLPFSEVCTLTALIPAERMMPPGSPLVWSIPAQYS
jgi:hypothetical protein